MIGIAESLDGVFSISDLKSVQLVDRGPGRPERYLVHRHSGGTPVSLFDHEYRDLMARPVQLLPAESGTRLIIVYGDEPPLADVSPVLAWALCMDGQMRPVLPWGVRRGYNPDSDRDWRPDYVQLPAGPIYEFGYETDPDPFDSIKDVLAREQARADRYEAERQQRAAESAPASESIS